MDKLLQDWFKQQEEYMVQTSRALWNQPEFSEHETYAAQLLGGILEHDGFTVQSCVAGLPTAFTATWGQGAPRIGFLAEYDALPGLAQKAVSYKAPIEGQEAGHGCGHNLLGVGALAAGMALKHALEQSGAPGTVIVYGCPSEELMLGKVVMTQNHLFDELDLALSWHPWDVTRSSELTWQALLSLDYKFTGRASHAAMSPEEGFSALDAVELMNVGANYLREHLPPGGQLHYTITNGGEKPNIVPEKAASWYFIRAKTTADVKRIRARLNDIAEGAAKMTGTRWESTVRAGGNETRVVPRLAQLMADVMAQDVPPLRWSAEEQAFARQVVQNIPLDAKALEATYGSLLLDGPLHTGSIPLTGKTIPIQGSTDVSDVSWKVPTAILFSACYPMGTPNHSWAVTACSGMSIGEKGMLHAARVMAATALRVAGSPALQTEIHNSFRQEMGDDVYTPAGV